MAHQDRTPLTPSARHHQDLKAVLDWLLHGADFSAIHFRDLCTWTPRALTGAALLWAWSEQTALTERFEAARAIALVTLGLSTLTAMTYQAFLKMRRAWTQRLVAVLVVALRHRMQADLAERFLIAGYAIFAVDGSRLELPRTASNQAHFAPRPKRRQRSTRRPEPPAARAAAAARRRKVP